MASTIEDQIAQVLSPRIGPTNASVPSQPPSTKPAPLPPAASGVDDLVRNALGKHAKTTVPFSDGLGRSVVSGLTAGFDDEIVGAVMGDKAKEERRALKHQFETEHPNWDMAGVATGAVGSMLLPGAQLSRVAQAGRAGMAAAHALQVAQAAQSAGRAMTAAEISANLTRGERLATGSMAQGTALAVPYGAAGRAGNADNMSVSDRAMQAASPSGLALDTALGAGGGKLGDLVGRGISKFADKGRQIAAEGQTAEALGSRPDLYARQSLNRDLLETRNPTGRPVDSMTPAEQQAALDQIYQQVEQEALSVPAVRPAGGRQVAITPDAEGTIIREYYNAIENGADEAASRAAAAQAYRSTHSPSRRNGNPISDNLLNAHIDDVLDAATPYRAVHLNTAEVLSGERAGPIRGQLKSVAQHVANTPGEARANFNTPAEERVAGRLNQLTGDIETQGSIGRTRQLVNDTLGDPNYRQYMNDLQESARAENSQNYARAAQNAEHFDLGTIIRNVEHDADQAGGGIRDAMLRTARELREWRDRTGSANSPAQRLESYKQMRSALTDDIDTANAKVQRPGEPDKTSAVGRQLQQIKRNLDAEVRRVNPDWWDANIGAADNFAIERAARLGRNLKLDEGAAMQDAKHAFEHEMSQYEREAFAQGLARQIHDALAKLGDTHDVSKIFLKGGNGQMDEGMRGLLVTVLGPHRGAAFIRQIERERIAVSTQRLSKGSQTSALEEEKRNRDYLTRLKGAVDFARHPISSVADHVIQSRAAANSRAIDAAMGRVLGEMHTGPQSVDRVISGLRQSGVRRQLPQQSAGVIEQEVVKRLPYFGAMGAEQLNRSSGGTVADTMDAAIHLANRYRQ